MRHVHEYLELFSFALSGEVPLADAVTETAAIALGAPSRSRSSTTNQAEAFAWTNANMKGVYIKSDQTLTLGMNSSGSPQDTITITAGNPFIWWFGSGITNPFLGNVTNTYWTNAGSVTANVFVRVLTS